MNNTDLGDVSYRVDWDAAFNGLNHKYRKAFVRVHLSGAINLAKSSVDNASGFVSLVGLGSPFSYSPDGYVGITVGDLQFSNSAQISAAETGYYMNLDTRAQVSVPMCFTPKGVMNNFTIRLYRRDGTVMENANLSQYVITLIFDLFDEIEPDEVSRNVRGPILPLTG